MAGEHYRNDLAAAQGRIAELEDRILGLEAQLAASRQPAASLRLASLERRVELARGAADEPSSARRRLVLQLIAVVFPVLGLTFTLLDQPLAAASCSIVFVMLVAAGFVLRARLKSARRELDSAELELAEARKVHALEQKLAALMATTTSVAAAASSAQQRLRLDVGDAAQRPLDELDEASHESAQEALRR